ncbi:hypothetical protein CHH83_07405 [Bacillus sp. 7586-K]|nr:hypothetical protein CHH83_07405 [Bacillus sp. 7586-K]
MGFELKPEIKEVLEKMNFLERSKNMSKRFNESLEDCLGNYDVNKVIHLFNRLGYVAEYDGREEFFKTAVVDNSPNYKIWFNIRLKYGMGEFIWVAYHQNEVRTGSPWSIYVRFLDPDEKFKKPTFGSYEELEELLKEAFLMYEDFKSELISIYEED